METGTERKRKRGTGRDLVLGIFVPALLEAQDGSRSTSSEVRRWSEDRFKGLGVGEIRRRATISPDRGQQTPTLRRQARNFTHATCFMSQPAEILQLIRQTGIIRPGRSSGQVQVDYPPDSITRQNHRVIFFTQVMILLNSKRSLCFHSTRQVISNKTILRKEKNQLSNLTQRIPQTSFSTSYSGLTATFSGNFSLDLDGELGVASTPSVAVGRLPLRRPIRSLNAMRTVREMVDLDS